MCKPVIPFLQDEIAHIFWKAGHIATVHHHHGGHHAEEEVAAAHKEESDKVPATSKISEPVSFHLMVHRIYVMPPLLIKKQKFGTRIYSASLLTLDKHYPPPRPC